MACPALQRKDYKGERSGAAKARVAPYLDGGPLHARHVGREGEREGVLRDVDRQRHVTSVRACCGTGGRSGGAVLAALRAPASPPSRVGVRVRVRAPLHPASGRVHGLAPQKLDPQ